VKGKIKTGLALTALVGLVLGCSAPPTPTRVPTPTITLPPPPPTATRIPPSPTLPPTLTPLPPTPTVPLPTPTRTRTPIVATPKPAATPTPIRPPNPTGSIAFRVMENGVHRLAIIDVTTGAVRPFVTVGPVMDLTLDGHGTNAHVGEWSPASSAFAYIFTGAPGASNILKIIEGNREVSLYSSDAGGGLSSPTWSSDGKRIAFIKMGPNQQSWAFIVINADGTKCGEKFECTIKYGQGEQYRGGLSWGKENLLTISYNTTQSPDVYTIYANGEGARNLTNLPTANNIAPVFSPDGKSIAFASNRDGGKWRIYVMNADGSNVRALTPGPMDLTPTWSPDGNWIAFASTRGGQFDIWMVDKNGGNLTQITKTGGTHPTWTR
jgi:Tol biopolymer transport system component